MNKKLLITTTLSVSVLLTTGITLFAQPKLSKEKKEFYNNKIVELNNENDAIGQETLKIVSMTDGIEKENRKKELREREDKYNRESTEITEKIQQDGYVNDEKILDSNAKLVKKLDKLRKCLEWDISSYEDQELIDYDTKQQKKINVLLEKVKKSDDSKFSELLEEYNQMMNLAPFGRTFKMQIPILLNYFKKKDLYLKSNIEKIMLND